MSPSNDDDYRSSNLREYVKASSGEGTEILPLDHPVRALMQAILLRAIEDFQAGGGLRDEAIRFLRGEDPYNTDHLFSFGSICDALGLSPEAVLKRLHDSFSKVHLRRRVVQG